MEHYILGLAKKYPNTYYQYFFSDASDSFSKGILSQATFDYGKSRASVSLKICFLSWLYELFGTIITSVSPFLLSLGWQYHIYFDAILMFLGIPFFHLMNDEVTKGVIVERGWFRGFKHMVGFRNQIEPNNTSGNQNS